jgi:uncharacterized membrane protein
MGRARVDSIDALRGFVMVVMALDHVRGLWSPLDPVNIATTTPALFATRWITHLCAPTFVLLAGAGAGLSSIRKPKNELSRFLLTRGLWLIVLELTVVKFGFDNWTFWNWHSLPCKVIWAIGWSVIALAGLIYLPMRAIVAVGLVLVVGHNALDGISPDQFGSLSWVWKFLHVQSVVGDKTGWHFGVEYPLVPWVGVMALGYALGVYLARSELDRARLFARAGLVLVLAFAVLRAFDVYGDLHAWSIEDTSTKTVLSFMNVTKYPPSLDFLCVTLGLASLLLAVFERMRGALYDILQVFGRVPLFYYLLHLILISQTADLFFRLRDGAWSSRDNVGTVEWAYSLPVIYGIWIALVIVLYPACRWFAGVKARRNAWWLGYL